MAAKQKKEGAAWIVSISETKWRRDKPAGLIVATSGSQETVLMSLTSVAVTALPLCRGFKQRSGRVSLKVRCRLLLGACAKRVMEAEWNELKAVGHLEWWCTVNFLLPSFLTLFIIYFFCFCLFVNRGSYQNKLTHENRAWGHMSCNLMTPPPPKDNYFDLFLLIVFSLFLLFFNVIIAMIFKGTTLTITLSVKALWYATLESQCEPLEHAYHV